MLINYSTLENNTDLSDFTGFTVRSTDDNESIVLTNYVDGEEQEEFIINPDNESIEEKMAEVYPIIQMDLDDIPLDEDGEIDYDKLPEPPEDFTDKTVLVEPEIMEKFIENTYSYPYICQNDNEEDEYDSDYYLEKQIAESEAEEKAFERYERFVNFLQDYDD